MDVSKETDYRHFERKECFHYLTNVPQSQESGRCSEVNILVVSEVTTKSVSMKLRRASVQRGRCQQRDDVKFFRAGESRRVPKRGTLETNAASTCSEISAVLLNDTGSSQSDDECIDLTVVDSRKADHGPLICDLTKRPLKKRREDPTSLSCDQWVLLKKWHPQKHRHKERGILWRSLSQIRKLASQCSDSVATNRTPAVCSRPHVFQQRNLRRCKYLTSIEKDSSLSKTKSQHRKRPRYVAWPPIGGQKRRKRKTSMNNTLSQDLSPPKHGISVAHEDKLLLHDDISSLNADAKLNYNKQKENDVRGKLDMHEVSGAMEGTRRALKFDDTLEADAVETAEQKQGPGQQIGESQNGSRTKDLNRLQEEFSEESDGFRTPTDLFSVKPMITRASQKRELASADAKTTVQRPNFRSMLATLVKNQNQIIKESCQ
ncbi:uncharacterized protein si:ch211-227n13.3 isoform X3 [Myxocyprinus asiaticus]|uniref:uncharacterized protein si:ch211-227n13.3 isoform X3 n=1 Tax=Myxocyprinus asiaticus TaxID=70543 RepID=UPI002223AA49|nr:uncharacterized protein si:ch211-227n13.3 isoform X3 [Myxocyprinus asiaticus]